MALFSKVVQQVEDRGGFYLAVGGKYAHYTVSEVDD